MRKRDGSGMGKSSVELDLRLAQIKERPRVAVGQFDPQRLAQRLGGVCGVPQPILTSQIRRDLKGNLRTVLINEPT
jgi:hypothetical protein